MLKGITILIYANAAKTDLVGSGVTDEMGMCYFSLEKGKDYVITIVNAPEDHIVEPLYRFDGTIAVITLDCTVRTYSVQVEAEDGTALANVPISIYLNKALSYMAYYDTTDNSGKLSATLKKDQTYYIVVDAPAGYAAEPYYLFDGTSAVITLVKSAPEEYSVHVQTAGGMDMEDLVVYIYRDVALTDMVDFCETDDFGNVSFNLPNHQKYYIVIDGAPRGYKVAYYYTFSGNAASITLTSSVMTDQTLSEVSSLRLGDVMPDFEVTLPSGENFKLSEALKEKDMVLINFWYSTCSWCIKEFPFMEEAYQMYEDDVEIIALNFLDGSNQAVSSFQNYYGLSFPMAVCPSNWFGIFGTQGAPTSIIVDRYGVICHIEEGALTNLKPFLSIFDYFTGPDYEQKVLTSLDEILGDLKPLYEMPSSKEIASVINNTGTQVSFYGDDDPYSWPFIITQYLDQPCIKSSNANISDSYSILYVDVKLKAGQAVGFDYLISSERGCDVLYVIVDGQDIYAISGSDNNPKWETVYPWVATEDGTYTIAFCYLKDEYNSVDDDCVYIKNLRICSADKIDVDTYLPRQAATSKDGFEYDYVDVFLNPVDGYYHVGSVNGPLLIANLSAGYTDFNDSKTLWNIVYDDNLMYKGECLYDQMENYFKYASNSTLEGYCTVNEELATYLKIIADLVGFTDDEDEWLKMCIYYAAYGKDVEPLEDPIKGLASFSAYEATLGVDVPTNVFYYNTAIIPRGKLAKFVPEKSGVYRITSSSESVQGVNGWIFDGNRNVLLEYELDERMYNDDKNVSMVFYMEAGEAYYIDIAFWSVYEVGYIYYDIEYIAPTLEHFRLASMGYFTYDTDATGDAMYHLIAGGITPVLGDDGYYHEDLGNGELGSIIYADFIGITSLYTVSIEDMIDMGLFDFAKSEDDQYILSIMASFGNDPDATREYLREYWGSDYEFCAKQYKIEDVFKGIYHGIGWDMTEKIKEYQSKMYNGSATERVGCVAVDAELADLLQKLMDKYTFEGVDHSWTKMCYYYDYLGPEA